MRKFPLFIIIFIIGLALSACGSVENTKNTTANNSVLYARFTEQKPPLEFRTFSIQKLDETTGNEKEMAVINTHPYNVKFAYTNTAIYFINPKGGISSYDLSTKKQKNLPGTSTEFDIKEFSMLGIKDFILDGNLIFYLDSDCEEGRACNIKKYDLINDSDEFVMKDLHTKKLLGSNTGIGLSSYDAEKNTIRLVTRGGDGPFSWIAFYNADLTNQEINQTDKAMSGYCSASETECTPEEKAEEITFNQLTKQDPVFCGNTKVEIKNYDIQISNKNFQKELKGVYLGCL